MVLLLRPWGLPRGRAPPQQFYFWPYISKNIQIPTHKPYIFLIPHDVTDWMLLLWWPQGSGPIPSILLMMLDLKNHSDPHPLTIYILIPHDVTDWMVLLLRPLGLPRGQAPPPYISKTIQIPTHKPYIFLFLMMWRIECYYFDDPRGQAPPPQFDLWC